MEKEINKMDLGIDFIKLCQRNRFPLLFIDKVVHLEPGVRAMAVKNFSYNEWFFPAHFDDEPIVPGFVLFESMAQAFLMTFLSIEDRQGSKTSFISATNVVFRKKVVPGDSLVITADLMSFRHGIANGKVSATISGDIVCSCELKIGVTEMLEAMRPRVPNE